ncbi:hypothetical protein GCM10009584_10870 [Ornithinimicrobium humiphilum]|uniref:Uncharacterized protein n=1 Tax=Ornithinimicrobium humiphilum TaxID=125288 RepID=A0A543KJD6_9MICO|nr:hypothetical protein [Ornithinimicrobium humiphilum]TQM95195.1 hypothetical protein FB476_0028 [Ornithinimicrobium humiphilum]
MTPSTTPGPLPEREPEAHEDDPTGIRALLSALPDPGPMPADLVERIEARLAVEQEHRTRSAAGGLAARSDSVIDLAAERSRRRPGRTVAMLGVAAAGLLVATVTIGELAGVGPAGGPMFDSAAQVPTRPAAEDGSDAGSDSAGGADEESGDDLEAMGGGSAEDSDAEGGEITSLTESVLVLPPLGAVSASDLRDRLVDAVTDEQTSSDGAVGGTAGLTVAAARTCWQDAGLSGTWPVARAAQAELEGDRVVVLLGTEQAGTDAGEVVVLPWSCTTGEAPAPLHSVTWPAP